MDHRLARSSAVRSREGCAARKSDTTTALASLRTKMARARRCNVALLANNISGAYVLPENHALDDEPITLQLHMTRLASIASLAQGSAGSVDG